MYKTNVVSAGIQLNKITDLKPDTNTVNLEFMMWFRWRGNLAPNDVVFANAVTPIVLGQPERSQDDGDRHYRAWRVRGQFFLNSAPVRRSYNSELVDITFRHRALARNNLMYVDDVVGMDLAGGGAAAHDDGGWLNRLFGGEAARGSALARRLREQRVLAGAQGWVIDQALISQQLARAGSDGDPSYVGFGKPQPLFSHIAMDVVLNPDEIDIGSLFSTSMLIYLAIFALSGATLAHLLDRRDLRHFWRVQTLFLRLITWPVLLATGSVLALNYALANTSPGIVEAVDFLTRAAWWLVPARLLALVVERFIWTPLEMSTGRRVPTVFRIVVSILIYGLAFMGVIAFVMGKTVTSLLATSGLLTLIFGLAVQSNLKDIFSGVMLNLERPFQVNDWVRINRVIGQVHDISWRTTRLQTGNGEIVAFANGKVVDAEIENMSRAGSFDATTIVHMDPRCSPDQVIAALKRALDSVEDPPYAMKRVILQRVENEGGIWAGRYMMDVRVPEYGMRNRFWGALWPAILRELGQAGLTWGLLPHSGDDMPRAEMLRQVAE
jgi:potassium-dependent mechanosensitive channel